MVQPVEEPKAKRSVWPLVIAGVLLTLSVVYMLWTFDWSAIGAILVQVRPVWIIAGAVPATVAFWVVRSWRYGLLMRGLEIELPLWELYIASAISLSLANFTPMQVGEAAKVEMLRRRQALERLDGYGGFVLERVLDAYVLVLLACAGPLLGLDLFDAKLRWGLWAALVVLTVAGLVLLYGVSLGGPLGKVLDTVQRSVRSFWHLLALFGLTLLGWILVAVVWFSLLCSVELVMPFAMAVGATAGLTLINILSLIPGAFGISEVAAAQLFMALGYEEGLSQAGAIALRGSSLIGLLLGLPHLWWWRLRTASRNGS